MPDFLVIGAQKAGTTSLFHYLSQHPRIRAPIKKEIHYFDELPGHRARNFNRGERWYRAHFPLKWEMRGCRTFEATPSYLYDSSVAAKIATVLPKSKMIVLLRDPCERAISQYHQQVRKGIETLPIYEAFVRDIRDFEAGNPKRRTFLERGIYCRQLEIFFQYFPRESFHIIESEKLRLHTGVELRRVFEFLNVDTEIKIADLEEKNVGRYRASRTAAVEGLLKEFYQGYNQSLYALLGVDLGW